MEKENESVHPFPQCIDSIFWSEARILSSDRSGKHPSRASKSVTWRTVCLTYRLNHASPNVFLRADKEPPLDICYGSIRLHQQTGGKPQPFAQTFRTHTYAGRCAVRMNTQRSLPPPPASPSRATDSAASVRSAQFRHARLAATWSLICQSPLIHLSLAATRKKKKEEKKSWGGTTRMKTGRRRRRRGRDWWATRCGRTGGRCRCTGTGARRQ